MWTAALAILSLAVLLVWSEWHDFASMWVEGFAEYEQQVLAILGVDGIGAACALEYWAKQWPLAQSAYTGPANIYINTPAAALYIYGWTDDPYIYRYTGFVVILLTAWIFYAALRLSYPAATAFYVAALLLVAPMWGIIALVDLHSILTGPLAATALIYFGVRLHKGGGIGSMLLFGACAGACLLTRTEVLVWPLAGLVFFLLVRADVRGAIVKKLIHRWPYVALSIAAGFAVALPIWLFNWICPQFGILAYLANRPANLQFSLGRGLLMRLHQFIEFNLAQRWSFFEIWTPHYIFILAFALSTIVLARAFWRTHRVPFALALLFPVWPLSLVVTSGLRDHHYLLLQPAVCAVLAAAAHTQGKVPALFARWGLPLVLIASLATSASDLWRWHQIRDEPTMLTHSEPILLSQSLIRQPPDTAIYFTNMGLRNYVEYVSRGRISAKELLVWSSPDQGRQEVLEALHPGHGRTVFVAVRSDQEEIPIRRRRWQSIAQPTEDRLNAAGHVPRTGRLVDALTEAGVPYEVETVGSDGRYELYIVAADTDSP